METLLQTFALDPDGCVVSVEEVRRGLACSCVCPACQHPVIARQGDVREWHFAHTSGVDCAGGAESALHHAAKEAVRRANGISLPDTGAHSFSAASWLDFDTVVLEGVAGEYRIDCLGTLNESKFAVEILVTHSTGEDKANGLRKLGIPAIEVDIGQIHRLAWSWEDVEEAVLTSPGNRAWLWRDESITQRPASAEAGEGQSPSQARRKIRYTINQMIVYVSEYDWFTTVWSVWNPDVTPQLVNLCKSLGGHWQKNYRNWLLPEHEGVRSTLHRSLAQLENKQPRPPQVST